MIQYFLFENEGYALTRAAVLAGKSLSVSFDGAEETGALFVGEKEIKVRFGQCKIPVSYLAEGENRLLYVEQNGANTKRYTLESLYKCADVLGVKALASDQVSLALLASVRFLQKSLCQMDERVKKLEKCCFASPLFECEQKGENNV